MKIIFITLRLTTTLYVKAQEAERSLQKRIVVKTNLLNLFAAQKPSITLEKLITPNVSGEVSLVKGQFSNFLFTDHYNYSGVLLRAKKYFVNPGFGNVSPYVSVYAGSLKRTIETKGQTDNTGWLSYPSRDFSANSIRGGVSLGLAYFAKSKITIDALTSLGYGKYIKIYYTDANHSNGFLDAQIWLSLGYCF